MQLLGIKSRTTLIKYEKEGLITPTRPFNTNRKRYQVKQLEKLLKG
jgi:DNA-binding transcriptional MerR regulator